MRFNRRASFVALFAGLLAVVTCVNPNERRAIRAARLALATQPGDAVSGSALSVQPVVEVHDSTDKLVPDAETDVTASIAIGSGTLTGTTTVKSVSGVAAFTDLGVVGAGVQVMSFTSTGLSGATSTSFIVAQAPGTVQTPTSLVVLTQPGGAVSGTPLTTQPVVRILDQAGLIIDTGPNSTLDVTATIVSGPGTLSGTLTVAAIAGVATFTDLRITGSGIHVLGFSVASPAPSPQSLSNAFNVASPAAGPATELAIVAQPTAATSGVNFPTTLIELRDANGVVSTSSALVTATIASGSGTLAGITTVNAANGLASFGNIRINGSGAHTLSFNSAGLAGSTSSPITVTQVPASLAIESQPTIEVTGATFSTPVVISVLDNAGMLIPTSALNVTGARTSGPGTLSGTTTVAAVNGVATFDDLAITGTGTHTLTFSAVGVAPKSTSSIIITSSLGPPTQLALSTQPSGAVSGASFTTQPAVQVRDPNGSLVTGSTAAITASIASGSGTLGGTVTVNAVNGVATFTNLNITGSGSHALTFSAAGLTSATSTGFTVSSGVGAASQLTITTQPAGASSGVVFATQPVVQIRDANNSLVTSSTADVIASVASGTGALGGATTVTAVNGVATFSSLNIIGSGPHTLAFSSTGLTGATSNSFTLGGTATKLAVTTQPSTSAASGAAFAQQPVVRVRDASNNNVNQSGVNVTATIATGGGTLGGTKTVATDATGAATFSGLSITGTTGAHTLGFTATGLSGTSSGTITISAGPPTQLAITTAPSASAPSGVPFGQQPQIRVRDASGTNVSQAGVVVTAALASGSGALSGTVTATTDATGTATFADLTITGGTVHTLTFTAAALTSATSGTITITGPATQLSIATAASASAPTGAIFAQQPAIQLRDASSAAVFQSGVVVTVAITVGGGTLGGTATATTNASGVATFFNLSITGTPGDRTLSLTAPTLTGTSAVISITAPPPTNEPSNFALITQRDFAAKVENSWLDRGDAEFSIQNDATAPRGDGKVGQALFPAGFGAGSGPINTYFNVPGNIHQLYFSMWVKLSPNFEGQQAGVNKIVFIWIDANANVFLNAQGQGSGILSPSINLQNNVGGAIRLNPNLVPNVALTRGVWHFWEVLLVANTVGQLNGSVRWWLDGVEIGNVQNIGPAKNSSNRWEIISWNPTWGGAGGTVTADMMQFIDYIRVSGIP